MNRIFVEEDNKEQLRDCIYHISSKIHWLSVQTLNLYIVSISWSRMNECLKIYHPWPETLSIPVPRWIAWLTSCNIFRRQTLCWDQFYIEPWLDPQPYKSWLCPSLIVSLVLSIWQSLICHGQLPNSSITFSLQGLPMTIS